VTLFGRTPLVAAYVCPRGVFAIVGKRTISGFEVERVLDVPAVLESEVAAADHVVTVLRSAMIPKASISLSLRGFGVTHHFLQLPPARDSVLEPIIGREFRRLEPDLGDGVVGWTPLPSLGLSGTETVPQRFILAASAPRATVAAFEQRLRAAGHRVAHITALPAGMVRLIEEFDEGPGSVAIVAPLPDGAFMGFSLGGGLRLVVEPPLHRGAEHDSAAIAEELELGTMFVRQQFRGAPLDRIAVVGAGDGLSDLESAITERLHLPVKPLGVQSLSPAAFAALGALLDGQSPRPLVLGGDSRARVSSRSAGALQAVSVAAMFVLALVGAWTVTETVRAKRADSALRTARLSIQQDSFGLAQIRSTADQRRLVRDAISAARVVARDRIALQEALAGISTALGPMIRLDSLRLDRSRNGWKAVLGGSARGATNAEAIQSLHDAYREMPQRLAVDSLRLDQLAYSDSGTASSRPRTVQFRVSFSVPAAGRK
jgi:hypothetical protein